MQSFVANVTGRAERKTLNGREYIVVPVSMIVPGVLTGSKGSLYYPQSRVAQNASEWDGIPVTLGHPSHPITNAPQSARDSGVVDRVGMGVLRNSRFENGKLRADAWLDVEKTNRIAPSVHDAALNGQRVEVSTGLFTQEVERGGTFNGRPYTHEVVDYGPDHFAILTDQRGACSVQDGCGMNVHNSETVTINSKKFYFKMQPDIKLKNGKVAYHSTSKTNQGTELHSVYYPPKEKKPAEPDMTHSEFKSWHEANADPSDGKWITVDGNHVLVKNELTCPCGGTCRVCRNAAAMAIGSLKPIKPDPAVAAKSADAVTSKDTYRAASVPSADSAASPPVVENDDEMTDNDGCPCEGTCKSCVTKNSNPEGCNQYRSCGTAGGSEKRFSVIGRNPNTGGMVQDKVIGRNPNTGHHVTEFQDKAATASERAIGSTRSKDGDPSKSVAAGKATEKANESDSSSDHKSAADAHYSAAEHQENLGNSKAAEHHWEAHGMHDAMSRVTTNDNPEGINQYTKGNGVPATGIKSFRGDNSKGNVSKSLAKQAAKEAAKKGKNELTQDANVATQKAMASSKFAEAHHEAAAQAHDEAAKFSSGGLQSLHKEAAFYHREVASGGGDKKGSGVLAHSYVAKAATDKANEASKSAKDVTSHQVAKSLHYEASDMHSRAAATAREAGKSKLADRHEQLADQHVQVARGHKFSMTQNSQVEDLVLNEFLEFAADLAINYGVLNSNPEGCNQYKSCGEAAGDIKTLVKGGLHDSVEHQQIHTAIHGIMDGMTPAQAKDVAKEVRGTDYGVTSKKSAIESVKHYASDRKAFYDRTDVRVNPNDKSPRQHRQDIVDALPKAQELIAKHSATKNESNGYPESDEPQPRCPIKQTFQPKGFKGKGNGAAQVGARKGVSSPDDSYQGVEEVIINSNPEGINQYSHGASKEAHEATSKTLDMRMGIGKDAAQKLNSTSYRAQKASENGDSKTAMKMHGQAEKMHNQIADKAAARGDHRLENAHRDVADKHGDAAAAHEMSRNSTVDRDFSGLTNQGEPMLRPQMIQHLTTNCDCYKGKAAVLNQMTDEMLADIIQNYAAVELVKNSLGDRTMSTNAMPAALQKAMDKKNGKADSDEDEDEDEDEAPARNAGPKTVEEWLQVTNAPKAVRQLVQNAASQERQAKEQLVDILTANVGDSAALASLRRTYFNLPIKVLKAQVDALPTGNSDPYADGFEVDAGPNYGGAAFLGGDRGIVANRSIGNGECIIEEPVLSGKN